MTTYAAWVDDTRAPKRARPPVWPARLGFDFNLDFMFGLPEQSLAHWARRSTRRVALEPDHLSCYLLTVDEQVPMGRDVARGRLVLPDDDLLAEMYTATRERLAAGRLRAVRDLELGPTWAGVRHNLTYWRDGQWLGLGAGAASSYGGRRWKNTPVLERYIASVTAADGGPPESRTKQPDLATQMLDYLTLGLRLREGVSLRAFRERFPPHDLLTILSAHDPSTGSRC